MTTARDVSRVEEIRERERLAAKGPWSKDETTFCVGDPPRVSVEDYQAYEIASMIGTTDYARANASFIAHSRADIPYLLALLADREAELVRVREALSKYGTHIPYCKAYRDEDGPCSCGLDAALSPGSGKEGA